MKDMDLIESMAKIKRIFSKYARYVNWKSTPNAEVSKSTISSVPVTSSSVLPNTGAMASSTSANTSGMVSSSLANTSTILSSASLANSGSMASSSVNPNAGGPLTLGSNPNLSASTTNLQSAANANVNSNINQPNPNPNANPTSVNSSKDGTMKSSEGLPKEGTFNQDQFYASFTKGENSSAADGTSPLFAYASLGGLLILEGRLLLIFAYFFSR